MATNKEWAGLVARQTLRSLGIDIGEDFHRLSARTVDKLLVEANRAKYRKPQNANGSRARYFHDLLQRRARWVNR